MLSATTDTETWVDAELAHQFVLIVNSVVVALMRAENALKKEAAKPKNVVPVVVGEKRRTSFSSNDARSH